MVEGIRSSASALSPLMRAQEVMSNNLANVSTPGFQQDRIAFTHALAAATGRPDAGPTGAQAALGPEASSHLDARPGHLDATGNRWDLAVSEDAYFAVQGPQGELYTRDGALHLDAEGTLLHRSGHPLLSDGGPLTVPPGAEIRVEKNGLVFANERPVGQIRVVQMAEGAQVEHAGSNLLRADVPAVEAPEATVLQGTLEQSNVEAVETLIQMMAWVRAFEANQSALMTQDAGVGQLIQWASR